MFAVWNKAVRFSHYCLQQNYESKNLCNCFYQKLKNIPLLNRELYSYSQKREKTCKNTFNLQQINLFFISINCE